MMTRISILAIALMAIAVPAFGQDSVAGTGAVPGDALSPWSTADQCFEFDVDLTPFTASWGTEFGICPLLKSSNSNGQYFNNFLSAQGMSRLQLLGEQNQFAVVFAEYGTTDLDESYNGVVGGIVTYDPANPTALHVKRVLAASNSATNGENRSQFGIGSVDESGSVMFRADGFGVSGPNPLPGDNIFHVSMADRDCDVINTVDSTGLGDAAAGNWVIVDNPETHGVPNIGPTSVFGEPYYFGANYISQFVSGPVVGPVSPKPQFAPGVTDQRGAVAYLAKNVSCIGGDHGTAAVLGVTTGGTNALNIFGLDATGTPVNPTAYILPDLVVDNWDGVTNIQPADQEFDHYHSQTGFRGGNSQIAMNVDQAGRLLAAAVVYQPPFNDNPINYIAVCRVDCAGETEWTMAAYTTDETNEVGTGKPILDGPNGNEIGQLAELWEVTGGSPLGPSMSAPMIDSAGNVWFIGAVALDKVDPEGQPYIDYDSALIRAIYDPATFSYQLELIFEISNVFLGQNSGLEWQINFLGISDGDSVSSGTAWSQNISENAHLGLPVSPDVDPADPTTLGGIVISADVTWDIQGDGEFNDPTSGNYDPNLPSDESYQVLLYIGSVAGGATPCPWDFDGNGFVGPVDAGMVKNNLGCDTSDPACAVFDLDGNGFVGPVDVGEVKNNFGPCPE